MLRNALFGWLALVSIGMSVTVPVSAATAAAPREQARPNVLSAGSLDAFRQKWLKQRAAARESGGAARFEGADVMAYINPGVNLGQYDSLWLQVFDKNFTGYNAQKDFGPQNDDDLDFIDQNRPAVVTTADGTFVFWVSLGGRLFAETSPFNSNAPQNVEITGDGEAVRTIALSPNGRWLAFTVPNLYDKHLYLYDFESGQYTTLTIPRAQATANDVLFAREMSFDRTSSKLMFELKRCDDPGQPNCDPFFENQNYWDICELDLDGMTFHYPFPAKHSLLSLRVPEFANLDSTHVLVSAVEFVNSDFESSVRLLDLTTGNLRKLFGFPRGIIHFAYAEFWSRDSYITYLEYIDSVTFYAKRVPINAAGNVNLANSEFINDYPARVPRMARVGGPVNAVPVANKDTVTAKSGIAKVFDVLANDTDADGDVLTIVSVGTTDHGGTARIVQNGTRIRYTAAAGFTGTEVFRYAIADGKGGRASGRVVVTVSAPN